MNGKVAMTHAANTISNQNSSYCMDWECKVLINVFIIKYLFYSWQYLFLAYVYQIPSIIAAYILVNICVHNAYGYVE